MNLGLISCRFLIGHNNIWIYKYSINCRLKTKCLLDIHVLTVKKMLKKTEMATVAMAETLLGIGLY